MEEIRQRILYLRDVIGLSFYQISEQTGISRKRAARIYRGASPGYNRKRSCLLDKYHPLIFNWFREYPSLKALQVFKWLRERGVKVSYPLVVKYTREFRRKKEKGRVERVIRTMKTTFFNNMERYGSLSAINQALHS